MAATIPDDVVSCQQQRPRVKLADYKQRTDSEDMPDNRELERSDKEAVLVQTIERLKGHVMKLSQSGLVVLQTSTVVLQSALENDMKYIWKVTKYTPDESQRKEISDVVGRSGFLNVCEKLWMFCHNESFGLFDPEFQPVFRMFKQCLYTVWNLSDASNNICQMLRECGFLQKFLSSLESHCGIDRPILNSDRIVSYVKCLLGILHNIVRHREESHPIIRQSMELFLKYAQSEYLMVKTKAMMIISYIIRESETHMINSTIETITFMTLLLRSALESLHHFSSKYGICASEVVKGLNNLAVNDGNKLRILEAGALPLYVKMLQPESTGNEQLLSAQGLWLFSFSPVNKPHIKQETGCLQALEVLAKSETESLCHAARGALWEIRSITVIGQASSSSGGQSDQHDPDLKANTQHVMISYQWDSKPIMLKVKDKLKDAGYKVWMDVEQMSGSTLEAMALAVEGAAVVIVAISQKYKDSPSCRTEAEYTYQLKKEVLPLQVEPNYCPDGWLGMLIGTRLYITLHQSELVESVLPRIVSELGERGKIGATISNVRFNVAAGRGNLPEKIHQSSDCACGISSSIVRMESLTSDWVKWSEEQVSDWLVGYGLTDKALSNTGLDGELLLELRRMFERAPSVYYSTMMTNLHLSLRECLLLSKALSGLC